MQTFLPYPDFQQCMTVLDDRRLGKQRAEALTILRIVDGRSSKAGWRSHPAVHMWQGQAECLKQYLNACLDEWERRGFKNRIPREKVDRRKLLRNTPGGWAGRNCTPRTGPTCCARTRFTTAASAGKRTRPRPTGGPQGTCMRARDQPPPRLDFAPPPLGTVKPCLNTDERGIFLAWNTNRLSGWRSTPSS